MKKIKCSRCHNNRLVEDDYPYKECPRCHERTVKRLGKIRVYHKKFDMEKLFSFPSWREYRANYLRWHKRKHLDKFSEEKLKKEYNFRKEQFLSENKFKLEKIAKTFHTREYPLSSKECLNIRVMVLEHFNEGKDWDVLKWNEHISSCKSCEEFTVACKRGEFYNETPIEPQKEEGYCSHEEWKANMDAFGEAFKKETFYEDRFKENPELTRLARQDLGLEKPQQPQIDPQRQILEQTQQDNFYARQQLEREQNQLGNEETERIKRMPKDKLHTWLESEETD